MKKVSLLIDFETASSQETIDAFLKDFDFFLSNYNFINKSLKVNYKPLTGRIRVCELPVSEVLDNLSFDKKTYFFNGKEYIVKMNSQRYFMFRENSSCVCCGLKGTRMFLEYYTNDMIPHFNLYGENNEDLILMTKDHITARALGGEDRHSNYQTMCAICNNLKGHTFLTLDSLKVLRKVFDEKKSKMTKKQIHFFLEECKKQLKKRERKLKTKFSNNFMILNCDLGCFLDDKGSIYGRHIYQKNKDKRIGCIKKGTHLEPILEYKGEIICSIGEKDSIRILKKDLSYCR